MLNVNEWDQGKALFAKLQHNDFFGWDIREQFSVTCVEKILVELSVLEPTKFIAVSYVSLLLEKALECSKVSLMTAILNDKFTFFANELRDSKLELDSYAKPKLDLFIENIQIGMERLCDSRIHFREHARQRPEQREGWNNLVSHKEIPLLARDALMATKLPLHWIYSAKQEGGRLGALCKVLHNDILQFSSLHELELSIHQHELAYGFRYVTVNRADTALHAIVYTSPSDAFIMAELHWDRHGSKMRGGHAPYSYQNDGLDQVRLHFPKLDMSNKLTLTKTAYQVIGSLKTCADRSKIWLFMLTELMSLKLDELSTSAPQMSIELLNESGPNDNRSLPVPITRPFTLEHKDIATIAREIGVDSSPMKAQLWEIVDSLHLDVLLPRDGCDYYDVLSGERFASLDISQKYNHDVSKSIVKLYPFPAGHFGTKESTSEAINFVLFNNLPKIINAKLNCLWDSDFEHQREWFMSMIYKRKAYIVKKVQQWHETHIPVDASTLNINQYLVTGIHEDIRRLALKYNTVNDRMLTSISSSMPALYKKNRQREVKGLVTENRYDDGCEVYVVIPNSTEEIIELLNCKVDELPELLRCWQRWANHGEIKYPWQHCRNYPLHFAAFRVYY
ncbi:hypothetical protein KFE26_17940 [Shewanella sp. M16]|uniref:hypothetical protein n=1 Tax=Shewanella sp. M16 TaxID=2830837 RepID=UPI001BAF84F5|nr:hypothetical protein [Shewanella sp. M16]MBS0044167.1 hypothetical protein [Shewanella sp. M16]